VEVLHRVGGSVGFVGAARSVLFFARHPEDPAGERGVERVLVHVKNNVGRLRPVEDYSVEELVADVGTPAGDIEHIPTSRVAYKGESAMTNREALAGTEEQRGGSHSEPKPADRARWGIREILLVLGSVKGEHLEKIVAAHAIGRHTVQEVRAELAKAGEIERFREPGRGAWHWRLVGSRGGEVTGDGRGGKSAGVGTSGEVTSPAKIEQLSAIPVVEPSLEHPPMAPFAGVVTIEAPSNPPQKVTSPAPDGLVGAPANPGPLYGQPCRHALEPHPRMPGRSACPTCNPSWFVVVAA
jgi:hypothetical protein